MSRITAVRWGVLLAVSLSSAGAAANASDDAEDKLSDAVVQYGLARFDAALKLLVEAEKLAANDPPLRARVLRQRGIVEDVLRRDAEALAAFRRALELDPSINVDAREHRETVVELFECAKNLKGRRGGSDPTTGKTGDELRRACRGLVAKEPEPQKPEPKPEPPPQKPEPKPEPPPEKPEPPPQKPEPVKPVEPAVTEASIAPPWTSWVAFGVGAASLGVGAGFGASALSSAQDGDPSTRAGGGALIANFGYGVAGAAVLTGVALWLIDLSRTPEPAAPAGGQAWLPTLEAR